VSAASSSSRKKKGTPSGVPFVHPHSDPSVPCGLAEELALERVAVVEHDAAAAALWRARRYGPALAERAAAVAARAHVARLEGGSE
jgi:hypothetical protein